MKIASWNVNSLKVRLPQVLQWLESEKPDIIGLQETKLTDELFPRDEIETAGYRVLFSGQKTYNGVAIAARIKPDGNLSQWFSCVAYGMLAGLISRIMLMPIGILAETPLADRLAALAAGFVLFWVFKRHMLPATLGATAVFLALTTLRSFRYL